MIFLYNIVFFTDGLYTHRADNSVRRQGDHVGGRDNSSPGTQKR